MTKTIQEDDSKLLAALALAMVEHPRANLQQLARAAGISKATLYRFCNTRELLIERLIQHANDSFKKAIDEAELDGPCPSAAFKRLMMNSMKNSELSVFMAYYWLMTPVGQQAQTEWLTTALDEFFLRGQQEGVFRIDIPAAAMTELWCVMLSGLHDAERRGRVARAGLEALCETAFLKGMTRT